MQGGILQSIHRAVAEGGLQSSSGDCFSLCHTFDHNIAAILHTTDLDHTCRAGMSQRGGRHDTSAERIVW